MSTVLNDTPSVSQPASAALPQAMTWTRAEFIELSKQGYFDDRRVELVEGEILIMPHQEFPHSYAIDVLFDWLRGLSSKSHWVRYQLPIYLGQNTYLEPDVSMVLGSREDYRDHPEGALFVAEVSQGTLHHDRHKKGSLYARAGIPEFWLVNLVEKRLEIYRSPHSDHTQPYGFGYSEIMLRQPGESASPLLLPNALFEVKQLFRDQ